MPSPCHHPADAPTVSADLPSALTPGVLHRRRRTAGRVLAGWLGLALLFLTIWALTHDLSTH